MRDPLQGLPLFRGKIALQRQLLDDAPDALRVFGRLGRELDADPCEGQVVRPAVMKDGQERAGAQRAEEDFADRHTCPVAATVRRQVDPHRVRSPGGLDLVSAEVPNADARRHDAASTSTG